MDTGMDGLAGGVVFFTCLLMIILSVMRADYLAGIYFAALGGAVLGFLRYNFNPASIFLGDRGLRRFSGTSGKRATKQYGSG